MVYTKDCGNNQTRIIMIASLDDYTIPKWDSLEKKSDIQLNNPRVGVLGWGGEQIGFLNINLYLKIT